MCGIFSYFSNEYNKQTIVRKNAHGFGFGLGRAGPTKKIHEAKTKILSIFLEGGWQMSDNKL
jgi:hypothetical protein